MKKRILSIFLAVLLFCSIVFSPGAVLPVRASSVAYSPEASLEIMEILYTLLINGMMASGAADIGSLDYDSSMGLFGSFMDSACHSAGLPSTELELDADAVYMVLDDGTVITWGDIAQSWTDGSGALQLPDEDVWRDFRVVDGGSGTPGGGPGDDDPFTKVEAVKIGMSFLTVMASWITLLLDGGIEGLAPEAYFSPGTDYQYDGYVVNAAGLYQFNGHFALHDITVNKDYVYDVGTSFPYPVVGVRVARQPASYFSCNGISFFRLNKGALEPVRVPYSYAMYDFSGKLLFTSSESSGEILYTDACAANIPLFDSREAALAFLQDGDLTGLLNGEAYDFPVLAGALAGQLAPFAGIYFDPAALPSLSQALDTALAPLPLPDANPAANTEAYKAAVTEAVAVSVPDALPEPSPEPAPDPDPDTGEMEKYKTDLRMVFPFCLPFDFIHFLKVMDADPVAPHFEFPFVVPALGIDMTVDIDLSFMDGAVEVFRVGELVSFILLLIAVTPKLIRW